MHAESEPILLVEDDDNDVFFFQSAFQEAHLTNPLQIVHDGQEAIDYIEGTAAFADRAHFPLPCVILLDLKLPKRTGFEVLEFIRDHPRLRTTIVIVLSSSSMRDDIEAAYERGANCFVVKPASIEDRVQM